MIRIALASTNPAKIAAVKRFARHYLGPVEICPIAAPSGISETPMSDAEAILGCQNRVRVILAGDRESDYVIALEGMARAIAPVGTFLYGWAMIHDPRTNRQAYGCSGKVQIPPAIASRLSPGTCLSALVESSYRGATRQEVQELGANGIITRGIYCRADEFFDALRCAHGYLANETNQAINPGRA